MISWLQRKGMTLWNDLVFQLVVWKEAKIRLQRAPWLTQKCSAKCTGKHSIQFTRNTAPRTYHYIINRNKICFRWKCDNDSGFPHSYVNILMFFYSKPCFYYELSDFTTILFGIPDSEKQSNSGLFS